MNCSRTGPVHEQHRSQRSQTNTNEHKRTHTLFFYRALARACIIKTYLVISRCFSTPSPQGRLWLVPSSPLAHARGINHKFTIRGIGPCRPCITYNTIIIHNTCIMYWYYFVKLSKSYCRKAFRFARNPEALAMSSSVRAHALSRARYDDNDGVDVGAVGSWRSGRWRGSNSHLPARPPGWRKKTSQTGAHRGSSEEATPGRVPYSPYYSITCITNCITICETLVLRIIQE